MRKLWVRSLKPFLKKNVTVRTKKTYSDGIVRLDILVEIAGVPLISRSVII
jgi:hypothetical protein